MAIINSRQYFIDTTTELVGIKSGLAIADSAVIDLLSTSESIECWWRGDSSEGLRLHAEDLEFAHTWLLFCIGATPDPRCTVQLVGDYCKQTEVPIIWKDIYGIEDEDEESNMQLDSDFPPQLQRMMFLRTVLSDFCLNKIELPDSLNSLPGFGQLVEQYRRRNIFDNNIPEGRAWDGLVQLSDLFNCEDSPKNCESYLDQRFIDYLNAQSGDISKMHWRQFERLCAEYFRRHGYTVKLGPGRNDGGKDVVATKDGKVVGPDLVYVQCKRLNHDYEVDIDTVKAFWTTMNDDYATRGLIATTSRLAAGAKKYCNARKYRLSAVESGQIRSWIRDLAKSSVA
ncbi:restriction endonuclease [Rhodopirellula islandica]|nr:restriction endonuclease [Rhodopirellula islandica]